MSVEALEAEIAADEAKSKKKKKWLKHNAKDKILKKDMPFITDYDI